MNKLIFIRRSSLSHKEANKTVFYGIQYLTYEPYHTNRHFNNQKGIAKKMINRFNDISDF